jgi:hypothetical protein
LEKIEKGHVSYGVIVGKMEKNEKFPDFSRIIFKLFTDEQEGSLNRRFFFFRLPQVGAFFHNSNQIFFQKNPRFFLKNQAFSVKIHIISMKIQVDFLS